jgi:hypothetical protein
MQTQLRDVEIDRRLRGRSEMEAELADCEGRTDSSWLPPARRPGERPRTCWRRRSARAQIDR